VSAREPRLTAAGRSPESNFQRPAGNLDYSAETLQPPGETPVLPTLVPVSAHFEQTRAPCSCYFTLRPFLERSSRISKVLETFPIMSLLFAKSCYSENHRRITGQAKFVLQFPTLLRTEGRPSCRFRAIPDDGNLISFETVILT
jgi:hypothetical protein